MKHNRNKQKGNQRKGKSNVANPNKTTPIMPSITNIEKEVLDCIIGQNEQVRQILTAIYRSYELPSIKTNLLIIGSSGTGKTETIVQIAERLNVPYTIEDATKYTKEGYYGADVEEMVYNLVEKANHNLSKASKGIIIIDEIDKKAGHDQHDVSGVEVLKSMLKIIEGTTVKVSIEEDDDDDYKIEYRDFNTKGLTIVFLGAFAGLEKIRDKRLNRNAIGFGDITQKTKAESRFLKQDLVSYGMPEEFVGRIDTIVEMNKLTKENLATILSKSKLSIFKKYQSELSKRGIKLRYNEKIFMEIAEASIQLDTGARELSNTVNYIFERILYDIIANPGKYSFCKLLPGIVTDNTKYILS